MRTPSMVGTAVDRHLLLNHPVTFNHKMHGNLGVVVLQVTRRIALIQTAGGIVQHHDFRGDHATSPAGFLEWPTVQLVVFEMHVRKLR